MAIRKRKWKSGGKFAEAWSYVFDAPGSTRENRKQIFESGFASKKEAQDAEAARRIQAQRDHELGKNTPAAIPGTLSTIRRSGGEAVSIVGSEDIHRTSSTILGV